MPVAVDLPLANDPTLRAKQVLNTLLAGPVNPELRTLPPDAVLLAFYMLQDGTAIADFSEALATNIPSGIESEQMAVDSISKTLEANVPQVRWLKILIHGQEVDTLAGHLDLTRTFLVNAKAAPMTAASARASAQAAHAAEATPPPKPPAARSHRAIKSRVAAIVDTCDSTRQTDSTREKTMSVASGRGGAVGGTVRIDGRNADQMRA